MKRQRGPERRTPQPIPITWNPSVAFVSERLSRYPIEEEREVFLRERMTGVLEASPGLLPLWKRLAERDGVSAIFPVVEDDLAELLERGVFTDGAMATMRKGRVGQCHSNAAELYMDDPDVRIATGYAMSDDGVWRQHSWVIRNGKILETTEPRTCYFGVILEGEKASEFVENNL